MIVVWSKRGNRLRHVMADGAAGLGKIYGGWYTASIRHSSVISIRVGICFWELNFLVESMMLGSSHCSVFSTRYFVTYVRLG